MPPRLETPNDTRARAISPYRAAPLRFGPPLATYRPSKLRRASSLFVGASTGLAALASLLSSLAGGSDPGLWVVAFLTVGMFGTVAAVSLRIFLRDTRARVTVHEEGLVVTTHTGRRTFLWEDVTGVWARFYEPVRSPEFIVRLGSRDGVVIRLPAEIENARDLATRVQNETAVRVLADTLAALDEGERLWFGPLRVDASGIHYGNRNAREYDVDAMQLSFRWLEVRLTSGKRILLPTEDVQNVGTLLAVAARFGVGRLAGGPA
ncbi:DUF6585 family protein [Polyangium jinanense]|uniref:Uncharacterized protein n=1 Tax=Polyangium jinanense TaxID=2829994 RepID=A0A9X3WZJ1_9BACT|nr:DUF6585 family protein [Polyangium jinanense]MDC3954996.1 hypothetical protein [Polyangium jinanense]MDC3981234.1 hypothetical protein [Polyangium jinanense]